MIRFAMIKGTQQETQDQSLARLSSDPSTFHTRTVRIVWRIGRTYAKEGCEIVLEVLLVMRTARAPAETRRIEHATLHISPSTACEIR